MDHGDYEDHKKTLDAKPGDTFRLRGIKFLTVLENREDEDKGYWCGSKDGCAIENGSPMCQSAPNCIGVAFRFADEEQADKFALLRLKGEL